MITGFAPLSSNINYWPSFFGDTPNWLNEVGFINYEIYETLDNRKVSGQLAILKKISFPLFGMPSIEIALLNEGTISVVDFVATTIPGFNISLTNLNASLLIKNEWLVPVELSEGEWVPIIEEGEQKPFEITLGGLNCFYSLPDELEFDTSNLIASIDAVQLGNTGIIIQMTGVIPFLSSQQISPPGHQNFRGVGIEDISVILPFELDEENSTGAIKGTNILIGNSGFSGELALTSNTGEAALLKVTIGGFSLSLTCFSLIFYQNTIIGSNICGKMKIPGFKDAEGNPAEIDIIVHIGEDGEFFITASEDQGLQDFQIPNILTLKLKSLTVGRRGDRYFAAVSGNMDFDQKSGAIGQFLPKDVEITKMLIWEDGSFEFEGGALVLPNLDKPEPKRKKA